MNGPNNAEEDNRNTPDGGDNGERERERGHEQDQHPTRHPRLGQAATGNDDQEDPREPKRDTEDA